MAQERRGRRQRDAQLAAILDGLVADPAGDELIEQTIGLYTDIHVSRQSEKDKLKEKDLALIRLIRSYGQQVGRGKAWMLPGFYNLFNTLGTILVGIEEILWELKKLPGKPPWGRPGNGGSRSGEGPQA